MISKQATAWPAPAGGGESLRRTLFCDVDPDIHNRYGLTSAPKQVIRILSPVSECVT
jgi:hypothetical protein